MSRNQWLQTALRACGEAGRIERRYFRSATLGVETKGDGSPVTAADREAEAAIRRVLKERTPEMGLVGEEYGAEGSTARRWVVDPLDGTKNFVAGLPFFAVLIGLEVDGVIEVGVVHAPALGPGGWPGRSSVSQVQPGCTWFAVKGQGAFAGFGTTLDAMEPRPLVVSRTPELSQAFVAHGGLRHFQERGLWEGLSDLVRLSYRTRGFGDWWGHVLVAEGSCDAMAEAIVAYHDVAAIKVLIEEAGGVFATQNDSPLGPGYEGGVLSSNTLLAKSLRAALRF